MLDAQKQAVNETPYALVKLEESARIIRQAISELPALRKQLERNKDIKVKAREIYGNLQNQHRRVVGALEIAALSLLEAEQYDLANHTVKLGQSINAFNLMTPDYSKLCAVFNNYLSDLPITDPSGTSSIDVIASKTGIADDTQTTNNRIIGRLMNNVRMGYYPTCTDNIAHITRGIDFPESVAVNLLDPCCGCGIALRSFADKALGNGVDCKTYGIELDNFRAEEALSRIDRVGFGSFYHSRISNEAFHAMLLNPPYLSVMTESGSNARSEKKFLLDSTSNLMMGGLLIYIIPYYRLTADIARFLCDNFSDISVWKFTNAEFKKFKQIAVLGIRHKKRNRSDMVSALTSLVLEPDMMPELMELPTGRYQLPSTAKEVALFKGAMFNERELAEQLGRSKSFVRLFQRSKLDGIAKRPLLPLSLGQIGLVGGSGLINGPVECDTPHIIKGRIVKEKRIRRDENTNGNGDLLSTTLTEIISNKLIFNILTPAGFISLTEYGGSTITNLADDQSDDTNSRLGNSAFRGSDTSSDDENFVDSNSDIKFPLGQTVITCGAREILTDDEIRSAIRRHQSGDWGNISKSDWTANDNATNHGDRILSSYADSGGKKFWIITEHDRSYTTVLLPSEY